MAGIKDAMSSILAVLAGLPIVNNDNSATTPYVRVWNNQLNLDENGEVESFPKPAFFLQVMSPATYEVIGQGYRSADINFRVHIIHEYYNDGEGVTYEQDLLVFGYRDQILAALTYFTPTGCGPLTSITEDQDDDHKNLYHFIVDFVCNFTDSKGSRLDDGRNYYTSSTPPTALSTTATKDNSQTQQPVQFEEKPFLIPTR